MSVGGLRVKRLVLKGIGGAIKRTKGDRIPRGCESALCYGKKNSCGYCRHVIRMRRRERGKDRGIEPVHVQ